MLTHTLGLLFGKKGMTGINSALRNWTSAFPKSTLPKMKIECKFQA